jgi:hypothetical protein
MSLARPALGVVAATAMALSSAACARPVPELLARGEYAAARSRAEDEHGLSAAQVHGWVQAHVRLSVWADARDAKLAPDQDVTWPLRVRARFRLASAPLLARRPYGISIRLGGVLWGSTSVFYEAWRRAEAVQRVFGEGPPFFKYPGDNAYYPALVKLYADHKAAGIEDLTPPHVEKRRDFTEDASDHLLIPHIASPGPDAFVVTTSVQWPDGDDPPEMRVQFVIPLTAPPAPASRADEINAAFADGERTVPGAAPEVDTWPR